MWAVPMELRAQGAGGARVKQALPSHDPPTHGSTMTSAASSSLPSALPQLPQATATDDVVSVLTPLCLADFERLALERNPTLRQAAAQIDAALSRSYPGRALPEPVRRLRRRTRSVALGEAKPSTSGLSVRAGDRPASCRRFRPAGDRHRGQAPAQPGQVRRGGQRRAAGRPWRSSSA